MVSQSASIPARASDSPTLAVPSPAAPLPSDVSTSLNAFSALQESSCAQDGAGAWSFQGALANATDTTKTYTVAVAVTVGASVQGHALITKTVAAGKTTGISATDFAKTTGQAGTCEPVVSLEDAS